MTICAISTAHGGAIGVIRTSGSNAIEITDKIFRSVNGKPLTERKAYTQSFGHIVNENNEIIDEVLVSCYRAPHSYTGENSTEISCHGSEYILREVLHLLITNGCRLAEPGEFTKRAFINGKMDLSQAEAVADLIASDSAASHRIAMNQMRGGFSKELGELRDKLLTLTSLMELELDFSDHEDLEFADRTELLDIATVIEKKLSQLVQSFRAGNVIKKGLPVAIVGQTNTGKSTLLNALLGEERAIVSDIHGTTRDVIEDTLIVNGTTFRFIDTAGIRETTDAIENIGIQRSYEKLQQADIIIWMIDAHNITTTLKELGEEFITAAANKHLILAVNKVDALPSASIDTLHEALVQFKTLYSERISNTQKTDTHLLSAKLQQGITDLKNLLGTSPCIPQCSGDSTIVTNTRHFAALSQALAGIHRVQDGLTTNLSGDFISQDLRETIHHLSDIVGEVSTDSVLQNIFKNFCIGK